MKKLLAIMLLLMYGLTSTGMSISLHYCCGKLKSIDWVVPKHEKCGHDKKMSGRPCCETKLITIKDKSDQDPSRIVLKSAPSIDVALTALVETKSFQNREKLLPPVIFSPPPLSLLPIFIKNQVFRI